MTRVNHAGHLQVVILEGRVAGPWVEELSRQASAALAESPRLVLDLSGVTFADAHGVQLLRSLADGPVELQGASGFLVTLLTGARP